MPEATENHESVLWRSSKWSGCKAAARHMPMKTVAPQNGSSASWLPEDKGSTSQDVGGSRTRYKGRELKMQGLVSSCSDWSLHAENALWGSSCGHGQLLRVPESKHNVFHHALAVGTLTIRQHAHMSTWHTHASVRLHLLTHTVCVCVCVCACAHV